MSVKTKYDLKAGDGRQKFLSIDEWVSTLSEDEQKTYRLSADRHAGYTQAAVDRGDLTVILSPETGETKHVWKDEEAKQRGKGWDPVWLTFWNRYLEENNLNFEIVADD